MASEFSFNLKEAAIFQAIRWNRSLFFRFSRFFRKFFLILFVFSLFGFLYGFLPENFSPELNAKLLGLSIISLTLGMFCSLKKFFLNSKLKKPKLDIKLDRAHKAPSEYNLAEFLSFDVAKTLWHSIDFAKNKKLSEINSSVLLYFLLKENKKRINFIFTRALLDLKEIEKILEFHLKLLETKQKSKDKEIKYTQDFQETILESLSIAQKRKNERIELGDVFIALSLHDLVFKKILLDAHLKTQDIENLVLWLESLEEKIKEQKRWWEYRNLMKRGSMAKEWAAGFTVTLDNFSRNWSEVFQKQGFPEVIGHEKEITQAERILSKSENNNVLIVGETGTGRKSILQAITIKGFLGQSLPEINYKRVKELDLPALLARFEDKEVIETILDKIFREVAISGNVILAIDEFHNFVGVGEKLGTIDVSSVLSPYLKLPQFQLVAITNFEGLHRNIEKNPSLLSLFGKVEVSEISERENLLLLEIISENFEIKHKRFVSYPALRDIINYTERYLPNLPFPEKAIDLLNDVMAYILSTGDKVLLPSHVATVISEKIQIPVGEIEIQEKEVLLNLEKLIHQRIINQDEAVKEACSALRRARAEVTIKKGPIGCFLFLGPTGVGKTETAKALTEIYFGSENKMIRLDMSEFQNVSDVSRLIGSASEEGFFTNQVRQNPFSLILLDEIEKAHPNILNLFLQVLDEGHLTDAFGRKVDFKNSIIIATSNAGYKIILKALKEKHQWSEIKEELLEHLFAEGIFKPEFINRFDAVVVFSPLSPDNLLEISQLMLQKLQKNLKEKGINFIITQALKEKIVELGYNPIFGAREMRRVIQDKVENVLATALLSGKLKRGDRVEVEAKDFNLKINPMAY